MRTSRESANAVGARLQPREVRRTYVRPTLRREGDIRKKILGASGPALEPISGNPPGWPA